MVCAAFGASECASACGAVFGKTEGRGKLWHGHVTAVTVAPEWRRMGVARRLMAHLEAASETVDAYFVDLFVRQSNDVAIGMYEGMGYSVFRTVKGYYCASGPNDDDEDGLDMRKPLAADPLRESLVAKKRVITPDELEWS